jgi:NADH-quinone oxidoreductase subunit N
MSGGFDLAELAPAAPLFCVTAVGLLLLLLEAFAGGRSRGYLMGVSLAGLAVAAVFTLQAWDAAGVDQSRLIFHGMLNGDRFSLFCTAIFLANAALTVLLAPGYMREHRFEFGEFYALVFFATAGMIIMAMATDLLSVFLGLETMSLAVYVLTGSFRRSPKSSEAAMKYFVVGSFATAVLLYGIALTYGATASTSLKAIGAAPAASSGQPLLILGMLLVLGALAFKVAAVPFHMWAPDAYEGAPTPVTAFMAAGVKTAGFATALRIFGIAFTHNELVYGASGWASVLGVLSVATMTIGNLSALRQDNIKRMLAYSSIAHAGYLMLGVIAATVVGPQARGPVLYYLAAYTFTTLGAFGVVAWLASRGDERLQLDDWAGLSQRHPAAALAMTLFLLSLGGIPPTGGFFAKFYLFRVALEKPALQPLVVIAVLNSVISVFYYLRVVTAMYFREVGREPTPLRNTAVNAALILAALGTLIIGIMPGSVVDAAAAAASFGRW